jgi:hypothetical protein
MTDVSNENDMVVLAGIKAKDYVALSTPEKAEELPLVRLEKSVVNSVLKDAKNKPNPLDTNNKPLANSGSNKVVSTK